MIESTIILKQLQKHAEEDVVSFHIPGHKNGKAFEKFENKYFCKEMLALDVTEMPDTDNLYLAKDMIREAQERAAKVFHADKTFFLINGTSAGNISAMMAVLNPQETVIVPRDCHKSVSHGLIIGGNQPVYINPETNKEWGIPAGIRSETIEKAILENPEAKAVLLTYPNYYGICSDIKEIAEIVHKYEKILIVDEAHGSHFILSDNLPISAMQAGADIVSQSIHKTLPAFTQSSMLHVNSDRIDVERLKFMLMINQSSSPSYLLMASLDIATTIIEEDGLGLIDRLLENISYFESKLQNIKGIRYMDDSIAGKDGIYQKDRTKLVINFVELGIGGIELSHLLRNDYGIQMEFADINNVVGVASICNDRKDFDRLISALEDISLNNVQGKIKNVVSSFSYDIPKLKISPREAAFATKKEIPFLESVGKVSGEYIIPYPPGIPLVCPGEEITKEILEYVKHLQNLGGDIIGTKDENLEVIRVID